MHSGHAKGNKDEELVQGRSSGEEYPPMSY